MRIFFALRLPEKEKDLISYFQDKCKTIYKNNKGMTKRDNLHITLEFIGERSEDEVRKMKEQLISFPSFKGLVQTDRISYFHRDKKPISIILIKPTEELMEYRLSLVNFLKEKGFIDSFLPIYRPHITLFRNLNKEVVDKPLPAFLNISFYPVETSLMLSTRIDNELTYLPLFDFKD